MSLLKWLFKENVRLYQCQWHVVMLLKTIFLEFFICLTCYSHSITLKCTIQSGHCVNVLHTPNMSVTKFVCPISLAHPLFFCGMRHCANNDKLKGYADKALTSYYSLKQIVGSFDF